MKSWLVGKAPECDLRVDEPTVSWHHCQIQSDGNGYYIEDLDSTNGTFVNGRRVAGRAVVRLTDTVTVGSQVPVPWPESASPERREVFTIGSASDNDIVLASPVVSPHHARLSFSGHNAYIEDLGSTNGTYLGSPQRRITNAQFNPTEDVYFGDYHVPGSHLLSRVGRGNAAGNLSMPPSAPPGKDRNPAVPPRPSRDPQRTQAETGRLSMPSDSPPEVSRPSPTLVDTSRAAGGDNVASSPYVDLHTAKISSGHSIVLGRDANCDEVIPLPLVSAQHARLSHVGGAYTVEDLGSTNGTFVNGRRVVQPVTIRPGDEVVLADYVLTLTSGGVLSRSADGGQLTLEARGVTVDVPGKRLVDAVSLTIRPGEFVGLMGSSGAGKSTLMNALNGYTPPSQGMVLLNNRELESHYDMFRGQIGYVPQDEIIHGDLTVSQALYFSARLRLPVDFSDAEIHERMQAVMEQLGLTQSGDVLIGSPTNKGISGGQRKRVNLAMELLTDPAILFLDEPTSGLSSEDALTVMKLLRELAHQGKTILLTIHQPSLDAYRLLDNLVLIGKDEGSDEPGRLCYYGPAYPDAIQFFNPDKVSSGALGSTPSPDELLSGLKTRDVPNWTSLYATSGYHREYVVGRTGQSTVEQTPQDLLFRHNSTGRLVQQWWALVHRALAAKLRDTWNTSLLMVQSPLIAILIVVVFGRQTGAEESLEQWLDVQSGTAMTIFLSALSSLWFGCSNSAREIVAEWAIYRRERMVNLGILPYLASKVTLLGGLCFIQCFVFVLLVHSGCGLTAPWLAVFAILLLAALVGVGVGLLISAAAPTSEVAIACLPIVILPMVILGGAMRTLDSMPTAVENITMANPSRWAFEVLLLMETKDRPLRPAPPVPPVGGTIPLSHASSTSGSTNKQTENVDIAERFFPKDEFRHGTTVGVIVLVSMAVVIYGAVGLVLRFRDIR